MNDLQSAAIWVACAKHTCVSRIWQKEQQLVRCKYVYLCTFALRTYCKTQNNFE